MCACFGNIIWVQLLLIYFLLGAWNGGGAHEPSSEPPPDEASPRMPSVPTTVHAARDMIRMSDECTSANIIGSSIVSPLPRDTLDAAASAAARRSSNAGAERPGRRPSAQCATS